MVVVQSKNDCVIALLYSLIKAPAHSRGFLIDTHAENKDHHKY